MMPPAHEAPTTVASEAQRPLTAGAIAMINLQAQIDGLEQLLAGGRAAIGVQAELIELVALRGEVLGRIGDYEWAEEKAEQLTRDAPADGMAVVARARAHGRFHRFADALSDLDGAQRLGADPALVNAERAGVFQAIGRYEAALTIYNEAAKGRADVTVLAALATLHAERGEIVAAEQLFDESRSRYRGVSPFPLALLDFQRGLMWLAQGDLHRALAWFKAAVRRVPDYAPAQGHLAEVEAALGEPEVAIARLLPLTTSSDDPDYTASLARILGDAGRAEEAAEWRNKTAARYGELMARHPEAFADHAAEFWLDAGDAGRARRLAQMNLEVRQTPRAHELLARAAAFGALAPQAQSTLDLRRPRRKWGRAPEERVMTDKATNEARAPRKGLRSGALTEYTIVGKVKPGHEKAVRDALTSHLTDPRRSDVEVLKKVGIHTALHALFDNDTRLVATVWFENDFDKYFDDVITIIGTDLYESWLQHLEGFPEKGLLGGLSGQAGLEFAKNWLAQNELQVTSFRLSFPPMTIAEQEKTRRLVKAFQKVLDHPDAEQALKHPALKPLLEEAAD